MKEKVIVNVKLGYNLRGIMGFSTKRPTHINIKCTLTEFNNILKDNNSKERFIKWLNSNVVSALDTKKRKKIKIEITGLSNG